MKNLTLILALLLTSISLSFSQETNMRIQPLEKGNFLLGSGIGFSTSTADIEVSNGNVDAPSTVSSQFNFSPRIGYFFADNIVAGLGMQAVASKVDTDGGAEGDFNDARTLFGPFVRYYFPVADDQAFYLGLVTGFGGSTSDIVSNGTTQSVDNSVSVIGFGPGYTIFASNNLALETQLQYNFGRSKNTVDVSGVSTETTTKTNAFDVSIGVNYYFRRAK